MENISNAGNKFFWFQIKEGLIETTKQLKMGPVTEFDSFMSAGNIRVHVRLSCDKMIKCVGL